MRKLLLLAALAGCGKSHDAPAAKLIEAPATAVKAEPEVDPKQAAEKADEQAQANKLVGVTPPEWHVERWLNTQPLSLAKLKGDVVLVRWWTAGCPYCAASAPALNSFNTKYAAKGLHVVGVYHHKDDGELEPSVYEDTAKNYGFEFPLAFDPDWRTLKSWMRDKDGNVVSTGFTSVTFLIDKKGVIRHVHPGGTYREGDAGYVELQAAIEKLLAEPA
jgi:peroxiredoxin